MKQTDFVHPGIGCNAETLRVMKQAVLDGISPWADYYSGLQKTACLQPGFVPVKVEHITNNGEIDRFRTDAEAAWSLAVTYYVTGEARYFQLAKEIFAWYSAREDFFPQNFTDSYIKLGKYVYTMCAAMEILGCSKEEKYALGNHALRPIVEKSLDFNGYFMNQHTYSILGAMAFYILMDDGDNYARIVEWTLVNASAENPARSGALASVIREVDGTVELVEMGRDQDHAEGNCNNLLMMTRTMLFQHTLVDAAGHLDPNGVSPVHFLQDRLLEGFSIYCKYNLGYPIPWRPTLSESKPREVTYHAPAPEGKGDFSINGVAAAYCFYRSLGMADPYLTAAYRVLAPRNRQLARSGDFIRLLHNYAFDFWTGLFPMALSAADFAEEGDLVCLNLENLETFRVTPSHAVTLAAGTSYLIRTSSDHSMAAKLGTDSATAFPVRMRFLGPFAKERESTAYITDTRGAWRWVTFTGSTKNQVVLTSAGEVRLAALQSDSVEQAEWVEKPCEVETIAVGDSLETRVWYAVEDDGEHLFVQKQVAKIFPSHEEAKAYAVRGYDPTKTYERASFAEWSSVCKTCDYDRIAEETKKLRLLNPPIVELGEGEDDGGIDYTAVCACNHPEFLAHCADPDPKIFSSVRGEQELILDFGEGFRFVSDSFGLQARDGFPTRVNRSAFYGSDDGENWTKLTRDAGISADMQHLAVEGERRSWRYIRVWRAPDRDVPILDIGVLRLYGERMEL